jgi:hypothetical protein
VTQIFTIDGDEPISESFYVVDDSKSLMTVTSPDLQSMEVLGESHCHEQTPYSQMQLGIKGDAGERGVDGNDATGFVSGSKFIAVGATELVDQSQVAAISTEWVLVAKDGILDRFRRRKVSGLINGDFHTFDIYGNNVAFKPVFAVINGVMVLSVINNHANPITVYFSRTSV